MRRRQTAKKERNRRSRQADWSNLPEDVLAKIFSELDYGSRAIALVCRHWNMVDSRNPPQPKRLEISLPNHASYLCWLAKVARPHLGLRHLTIKEKCPLELTDTGFMQTMRTLMPCFHSIRSLTLWDISDLSWLPVYVDGHENLTALTVQLESRQLQALSERLACIDLPNLKSLNIVSNGREPGNHGNCCNTILDRMASLGSLMLQGIVANDEELSCAISRRPELKSLHIWNCSVANLRRQDCIQLTQLKFVEILDHSGVKDFSGIQFMTNLEHFHLEASFSDSPITPLIKLDGCCRLRFLAIMNTNGSTENVVSTGNALFETTSWMSNLTNLALQGLCLTDDILDRFPFHTMPGLTCLDLQYNWLTKLPQEIGHLEKLISLDLSENFVSLSEGDLKIFEALGQLQELALSFLEYLPCVMDSIQSMLTTCGYNIFDHFPVDPIKTLTELSRRRPELLFL